MEVDTLHFGDCREVLAGFPADSIDTCITDPPYNLHFMNRKWDSTGVAFQSETWEAVYRVLKPGAMLLAFGGTRTYHRLTCAVEDAGFEIRDCLMWLYGSGFPKSHDISKAIDKAARGCPHGGPDPQSPGHGKYKGGCSEENPAGQGFGAGPGQFMRESVKQKGPDIGDPVAKQWDGWGTALKPAWEPIILAMKPRDGTFVQNALEHGVAGLWIDGGRIVARPWTKINGRSGAGFKTDKFMGTVGRGEPTQQWSIRESASGRWPSNVILSHHPECVQVGMKRVKNLHGPHSSSRRKAKGQFGLGGDGGANVVHCDSDGLETVEDWDCHPDCPIGMFPKTNSGGGCGSRLHGVLKFGGSNARPSHDRTREYSKGIGANSGSAARFFYTAKVSEKERTCGGKVPNKHPTVKPLKLMEYLCKLTKTPDGGIVLDPFAGSGTTALACLNTGRHYVLIENDKANYDTAAKRISCFETLPLMEAANSKKRSG